eukprot:1710288-Pleurochrysis_carterae.AAC.1
MLTQLEELGHLFKNLGEAVGHLVTRADKVGLIDQAVVQAALLLDRAVRFGRCNAKFAQGARALCLEAVGHLLDLELLRQRERACVTIARDLETNELVKTSADLALEALIRVTQLQTRNGQVVNPSDYKKKRAVALEREDARFAPELREAIALKEVGVKSLPAEMSALASTLVSLHTSFSRIVLSYSSKPSIRSQYRSASLRVACVKALTTSVPSSSRSTSATGEKKMRMDVA